MIDIHATLNNELIDRILAYGERNGIKHFRDAVREYIVHLERAVEASTVV